MRSRIQCRCDGVGGIGKNAGELIEREDLVIPRVLVRLRDRRAGRDVVEVAPHDEPPRFVEPVERVRPPAKPCRGDRRPFGGIRELFVPPDPPFDVALRRQRARGVIRQLHLARIARKPLQLLRLDVEEELVGSCGMNSDRRFAIRHRALHPHHRAVGR